MARVIFCLIVVSIHLCLAQIPTLFLTDVAISGNDMAHDYLIEMPPWNAAGGKYIFVHTSRYPDPGPGAVTVYERDDQEKYSTAYQMPWDRSPGIMSTNGNWFGTLGQGYVDSFQLTDNGTFVNITSFDTTASVMQFLSDDTLLLMNNTSIMTYEFIEGNWMEKRIDNLPFTTIAMPYFNLYGGDNDSTPHITDTTMALFNSDNYTIELYTRHTDKSWMPFDSFPLDQSARANRILWNGDDTVVIAQTTFNLNGFHGLLLYMKNPEGNWNLTKVVSSFDLSDRPGNFGNSMLLYDRNTILVASPKEGSSGEVYYLLRINGEWTFTNRFSASPGSFYYFGRSLIKNDYDILVQATPIYFEEMYGIYVPMYHMPIPRCYTPIRYTCQDVTVDTCQTSLPYDQLYTVGNNCTTVDLVNATYEDNVSTYKFKFSSNFPDTFYCNATVTCLHPPIAPSSSVPISPPIVAPIAPVASPFNEPIPVRPPTNTSPNSPVSTPTSAGKVTSGGRRLLSTVISTVILSQFLIVVSNLF